MFNEQAGLKSPVEREREGMSPLPPLRAIIMFTFPISAECDNEQVSWVLTQQNIHADYATKSHRNTNTYLSEQWSKPRNGTKHSCEKRCATFLSFPRRYFHDNKPRKRINDVAV